VHLFERIPDEAAAHDAGSPAPLAMP
jgi:hypothetical protein